jgi:hypothetical protein
MCFSQQFYFCCVKELNLGSRPITMCDIAYNTDGKCWKCWNKYPWTLDVQEGVCPHLVGPKDFNTQPEGAGVAVYVHWFELDVNIFLEWIVTCDVLWVHYFTPELKWSCMYGISHTQKIKDTTVSQIFWDAEGEIHADFLPHSIRVNAQYTLTCFAMICSKWFGKKDTGNCQRRLPFCMTTLIHIWQIYEGDKW